MNKSNSAKTILRKLATCVLSLAFFLEGMMFYNHYSYAYHVNEVRNDLSELQNLLEDNEPKKVLGASILDVYEVKDDFGDLRLKNLTKKIVNSTEYAIENADDIRQVHKLKKAVDEISEVQDEGVTMIHSAMEKVKTETISAEVKTTYDKAVDLREKVGKASLQIQAAIDNHQDTIEIDILTDKDEDHEGFQEEQGQTTHAVTPGPTNPNLERILKQREEDAKQREANRKRIKLIEEGNEAQRAQKLKNKLSKAGNQQASS